MGARIEWSDHAKARLKEIWDYWNDRNGTITFGQKLSKEINSKLLRISAFPEAGLPCVDPSIRYVIERSYRIYYQFDNGEIQVITIWDMRRDPESLPEDLRRVGE